MRAAVSHVLVAHPVTLEKASPFHDYSESEAVSVFYILEFR